MADKNDIVMIELDRPRMLWFGHKALKTFSALTGKSIDTLKIDSGNLDDLEKIFYCGLLKDARDHGETLELTDMEDLMDLAPFGELTDALEKAFESAFGGNENDGKNAQGIAVKKK